MLCHRASNFQSFEMLRTTCPMIQHHTRADAQLALSFISLLVQWVWHKYIVPTGRSLSKKASLTAVHRCQTSGWAHEARLLWTVNLLMPDLHLSPFTPNRRQVINLAIRDMSSFFKNHTCIINLPVVFIKFGKCYPEGVEFTNCKLWVHRLHSFCVRVDDLKQAVNGFMVMLYSSISEVPNLNVSK